jgi:hypothetical protein
MQKSRTITVSDYDDLRESLPNSGLFEMTDCAIEIWCPEFAKANEVQRMVTLLESMVHVTDVRIGSDIENLTSESYRVVIIDEDGKLNKKKFIRDK